MELEAGQRVGVRGGGGVDEGDVAEERKYGCEQGAWGGEVCVEGWTIGGNIGSGLVLHGGCADVDDISYGVVVPVIRWFEIG